MKSLTGLLQRSFSSWGTKLAAVSLIITLALFSLAAGNDNNQGRGNHHASGNSLHRLAGAWSVEVTVEIQQLSFPGLLTFTSDGIVLAEEPPSPFETTGHGNWVATGPREAAFTFLALFGGGPGGNVSATGKVVGKLEYDPRADNWSGPFKIQVFDPDGNEIFADRGTFSGTRIAVETLD
jgi:hypothetical protein